MILTSVKDVNKKNYYADGHMKAQTSIMLKIKAIMIDADQVIKDLK
jgi:hypothetical protein